MVRPLSNWAGRSIIKTFEAPRPMSDIAFPTSARFDRLVIDCDLLARVYPTVKQCTPYVYERPVTHRCLVDAEGNLRWHGEES